MLYDSNVQNVGPKVPFKEIYEARSVGAYAKIRNLQEKRDQRVKGQKRFITKMRDPFVLNPWARVACIRVGHNVTKPCRINKHFFVVHSKHIKRKRGCRCRGAIAPCHIEIHTAHVFVPMQTAGRSSFSNLFDHLAWNRRNNKAQKGECTHKPHIDTHFWSLNVASLMSSLFHNNHLNSKFDGL